MVCTIILLRQLVIRSNGSLIKLPNRKSCLIRYYIPHSSTSNFPNISNFLTKVSQPTSEYQVQANRHLKTQTFSNQARQHSTGLNRDRVRGPLKCASRFYRSRHARARRCTTFESQSPSQRQFEGELRP